MTDEVLPISALSFDPNNPRVRTERSAHVIRSSLQRYGPLRSLVGQKLPDGRIMIRAGNGTLEEAGQIGIEKVRLIQRRADELVVVVADDLDEEKWVQYSVDDNRASDLSPWDPVILKQISQDIDLSNSFLEGELDELIESLAGLTEGLGEDELFEGETDPDDVPDFDEVETRVKKGDIWRLGRHRVMCGDSAVITDVERLMDGEKADMVFTDPPYNINFKPPRGTHGTIENDNMDSEDFKAWLSDVFGLACQNQKDDSFAIVWSGWSTIEQFHPVLKKFYEVKGLHIWVKNNFGIGYYSRPKYEPFFLLLKGSPPPPKPAPADVWEFAKVHKTVHSCEKPVGLIESICGYYSEPGDTIADFFLGSGSTLIAAEKTGRTCYGMELSEKYCDVILKRWEDFTGQTAERI